MIPYWHDAFLTVYQGDCREVMAQMEPESVHCVVTSPPYWGLRDYGIGGQLGLEPTPEEYVENMVAVFREVRRVLRKDGTCWVNLGDSYGGSGPNSNANFNERNGHAPGERKQEKAKGDVRGYVGNGIKPKDLVGIPATVLDPFAGSGTTGRVAQRFGRKAVLIDLSGEYLQQLMVRNADIPLGLAEGSGR